VISGWQPGANATDRSAAESVELIAGGVNDPDGTQAAAVLGAYFQAEHTRAARRLIWRGIGIAAAFIIIVGLTTTLLLSSTTFSALVALGAAGAWSAYLEWRDSARLTRFIAKR
jgi:hypothetical protein